LAKKQSGPGVPHGPSLTDGRAGHAAHLAGLVAPHIDLRRGGPSFARAYRQLRGRDDIELFVILSTGHQPMHHRFGAMAFYV
jgi:predicted class III extradiol MEMO1 family dioxygenase